MKTNSGKLTKATALSPKAGWCRPKLNRRGQEVFWDGTAKMYAGAQMTNDNQAEMDAVIDFLRPTQLREIVTLGGAVGCRDPKQIIESLYCSKAGGNCSVCRERGNLPKIVFTDLSQKQVEKAQVEFLRKFEPCVVENSEFKHGDADHLCREFIRPRKVARQLLLGIYSSDAFFTADPSNGFKECGYEEYLDNGNVLGHHFFFDWLVHKDGKLVTEHSGIEISVGDSLQKKNDVKLHLSDMCQAQSECTELNGIGGQVIGLQIVGVKSGHPGYFLSHWYHKDGVERLLRVAFPPEQFEMNIRVIPKGIVYQIRPAGILPDRCVTMLNNVLGNILPNEQASTLLSIKGILS